MGDTQWAKRAAENILPVSESDDFTVALTEWFYSGQMNDLEADRSSCGLCEHPDIRYEFEIVNRSNGNALLVGSECITKFEIPAVDEQGRMLHGVAAKRKVAADRRDLVRRAAHKSVITALLQLAQKDGDFQPMIEKFIQYYNENVAFTPNQLATVMWRMRKLGIAHNKRHFRMKMRRGREQEQLRGMEEWKVKTIWPCMTETQRKWYGDHAGEE